MSEYIERGLNPSANCHRGFHTDCVMYSCTCNCHKTTVPEELDAITDVVLAYRPKPKTKAAKRRVRKAKRDAKASDAPA